MKKVSLWMLVLILVSACSQGKKENNKSSQPDKQEGFTSDSISKVANTPVFWGVYEGVLPPLDGSAINILLTINQNNTYHERLDYIDRNNQIENRDGHYTVEEDMLVLYPDKGDKEYYRIEQDQLRKLNDQAQPVTGLLEDRYVLTKK